MQLVQLRVLLLGIADSSQLASTLLQFCSNCEAPSGMRAVYMEAARREVSKGAKTAVKLRLRWMGGWGFEVQRVGCSLPSLKQALSYVIWGSCSGLCPICVVA